MSDSLPSKFLATLALAMLAGCAPEPSMQMQTEQDRKATYAPAVEDSRVEVTRIGVFADTLAYENRRGVYLIRDKETGAEFIGVSGVGITEVGSHTCGKGCIREDER